MIYRAISLWEPWASAIRLGLKKYETRHWETPYRGPLVIHAAKRRFDPFDYPAEFLDRLRLDGIRIDRLHYGKLICLVDLVAVFPTEGVAVSGKEREYGNYEAGRFAWQLENMRPIEPVPCKGHQKFFNVELL